MADIKGQYFAKVRRFFFLKTLQDLDEISLAWQFSFLTA